MRAPLACLALLTLTGCAADPPAAPAVAASPLAAAPSSAPAPTGPQRTLLGRTATLAGAGVTATAYRYKGGPVPQDDNLYAAVDVKVCNKLTEPVNVSGRPWTLLYADDTTAGPDQGVVGWATLLNLSEFGERILRPGACHRGWVIWDVPSRARPVAVEYGPTAGDDTDVVPASWVIPAA